MIFKRLRKLNDRKTIIDYKIENQSTVCLYVDGEVIVSTQTEKTYVFEIEDSEQICDLKYKIEEKEG